MNVHQVLGYRLARMTAAAGLALTAGGAMAADTVIPTNGSVPLWKQMHDFKAQLEITAQGEDRLTDIRKADGTGWVTYKNLASDARTFWKKDSPYVRADLAGADKGSPFTAENYAEWAAGVNHCGPTVYGMMHDWMRTTKLKKLSDFGGEKKTIEEFAWAADTNDINYTLNQSTKVGDAWTNQVVHAGTYTSDLFNASNAFIKSKAEYAKDAGPKLKAFVWGQEAFKKSIDTDQRPFVLNYWDVAGNIGHAVMAVGYDADHVIVKDPADGTQKKKAFDKIRDVEAHWSVQLGDPVYTGFDANWGGTGMMTVAIPDYGDCDYHYELNPDQRARHRDQFAQRLGLRVSGEIDTFDAEDDEDGVANVGFGVSDRDGGDDGVAFRWNADGTGFADITVTTRDWVREADPEIDGPDGYGHAAADPNLYLSVWADPLHTGNWDTAMALLSGAIIGRITENGTGALAQILISGLAMPASSDGEPYWVRVRLSREAGLGAYGATEYGEVEDYRVPEPGVLALVGMALGLAARRRATSGVAGSAARV